MAKDKFHFPVARLCITAVLCAMNIIMSSFGIPVPGGHLYLNDVIICTASLILGPFEAFAVGGIGSFLGDFFFYPTPMFVSLVTHGLQAVMISLISHGKVRRSTAFSSVVAVTVGVVIMVVGYTLGRAYVYATPETAILKIPFQLLQAVVGAVLGIIIVNVPIIKKTVAKYLK